MGTFDVNCAITSVCLGYSEAVWVPLRWLGPQGCRPLGLAMKGRYDGYGGINSMVDSANTAPLVAFFNGLDSERLSLEDQFYRYRQDTIAEVCAPIAENTALWFAWRAENGDSDDSGSMASLDGVPLVHALIARDIWDAIVAADVDGVSSIPAATLLAELADPVLDEIYSVHVSDVEQDLRELVAVDRFLRGRGLPWKTHTEGDVDYANQQSASDLEHWLNWAYQRYGDDPVLRSGIDAHAVDVRRVRDEEGDMLAKWGL
ncbi:hypothetical protein SAMN04489765_3831 [Tsukamurella pulmonis]|uniref:Uncharacterized protein n=1 Tax=Tsukamurella pulmonis TaxID=47312 RepID=A0A1H1H5L1_9ACTN|nr:hypothetical protein [Tsukamurella pulmonis]SDR20661.1 hypothetical protein SAMN04489765_3831 [Tsukamurella pulmonis]SUP15903.1 Uncharacterised protein [Tsukamurella pulmonis]